ncbi:MAG: 3-dehydroquinate synthase [Chloroflexi bacterium]|nr:3-dehydroquinate synthase [Chloroflexota bacterium]
MSSPRRNIYLIGFSYTGKSTVARQISVNLHIDFADTDELIESRAGKTIPEIFATEGESVFRELESEVLREVSQWPNMVVATGGGIVLDPANRDVMQRTGAVISLEAQPSTILNRMRADESDATERPLLASGDPLGRIAALKSSRQAAYAIADWTVNTDQLTMEEVSAEAQRGAEQGWERLAAGQLLEPVADDADTDVAFRVRTETAAYSIVVAPGALETLGQRLSELGISGRVCVITDSGIPGQWRETALGSLSEAGFNPVILEIPEGEPSKNLSQAGDLFSQLGAHRIERRDAIVALGGGVVGDLAGYVAATYLRGIAFVQVPTTLLGMVDASIGGKVAIDLPTGKNLVGSFYQPRLVLSDTRTLNTLPPRHLTAGWAEVIKTGAIFDAELFDFLEANAEAILAGDEVKRAHAVLQCSAIKGRVVSLDEREMTGLRARLNLGHTLGHAVENALEYTGILHGEAVAIGTSFAAHLAERVGSITAAERQRQIDLLNTYGLPTTAPSDLDMDVIQAALAVDKKVAAGRTRWILCDGIGRGRLRDDVPPDVSDEVLRAFLDSSLGSE